MKYTAKQLAEKADDVYLEILFMHDKGADLSRRIPLERAMIKKYNFSPKQVMQVFRIMEERYKHDLISVGYRNFSRWGLEEKFPPLPAFRRKKR